MTRPSPTFVPEKRPERIYSELAILLSVLVLVIAWATMAGMLSWQWKDTIQNEMRQNANIAVVLKEHTLHILDVADQALRRVQSDSETAEITGETLVRVANETGMTPEILTQVTLVDVRGNFVFSNLDTTGERNRNVNLMDREHIQVHLNPTQRKSAELMKDGLFISKPLIGKVSGVRTIQMSRKLLDSSGNVAGVVVASINQAHFINVFGEVKLGGDGGAGLVDLEGQFLARVIGGNDAHTNTSLPSPMLDDLRTKESGANEYVTSDGVLRIAGFSRVGDYALSIVSGTSAREAIGPWRSMRNTVIVMMMVLSLVIAAFVSAFLTSIRRLNISREALKRSEAQAQHANQAKSEFLAAMSHELRTPLTSIRGFAELMEVRSDDALIREQSRMIRQGAEHLNALLTEILDLAKIEAGAMPVQRTPVVLPDLVREVTELFRVSAAAKSLELETRLHADVQQPLVTDALKLKQILNNLLSNAIKFTTKGSVKVMVEPSAEGTHMLFHVKDTGPGIAPEMQEAIFEKFIQGDARVSYQHGGTGLGLALSRALAEVLGGTLTVQSRPGEGAHFTLALPQKPSTDKNANTELPSNSPQDH